MNPTAVHSILERVTAEDDEGAEDHSLEEEEEEGAAHSLKDVCDFGKPEPSPFSSRRVMYENEEVGHGYIDLCTSALFIQVVNLKIDPFAWICLKLGKHSSDVHKPSITL